VRLGVKPGILANDRSTSLKLINEKGRELVIKP
jgi:hypothetical protein